MIHIFVGTQYIYIYLIAPNPHKDQVVGKRQVSESKTRVSVFDTLNPLCQFDTVSRFDPSANLFGSI